MSVAESLCWRLFQCIKSVINISNLPPTHLVSNIRHQHMICFNMIWFIRYGLYDMGHIIWPILYGPYRMAHIVWTKSYEPYHIKAYHMLVTDDGDQMCWWQVWDVDDRFNTKITNITKKVANLMILSPTS